MKKFFASFIILILTIAIGFSVSGCENIDTIQLNAPTNVRVEEDTIKWNSASNASGYCVEINGNEGTTSALNFPISSLVSSSGELNIRVKSIGNHILYRDSEWSNFIKYEYKTPDNEGESTPPISDVFGIGYGYKDIFNKNALVTINSVGSENRLISRDEIASGAKGNNCIDVYNLKILGNANLSLQGGNGANGGKGQNGGDGGSALFANNITINGDCEINLIGGKAGNAGACLNSYSSTATGASIARSGSEGLNGGNGGNAIKADSLTINSLLKLNCSGGDGGSGRAGGNGENSDCEGNPKAGNGGAGGNGGLGGSAIYLNGNFSITASSTLVILKSGNGGDGGMGGNAGAGVDKNRRDDGGDGGEGGFGGDSGYCIFANSSSVLCKLTVIASNGGNGGVGGDGGYATADASVTPKCGAGGNGGNGGKSYIASGISVSYLNISYGIGGDGGKGGSAGSTSHSAWLKKATAGRSGDGGKGGDIILNSCVYKSGAAGSAGSTTRINTYTGAAGGDGGKGASN